MNLINDLLFPLIGDYPFNVLLAYHDKPSLDICNDDKVLKREC